MDCGISLAALIIAAGLMGHTLIIKHDHTLMTGFSVYSDFGPHLAMIRSFSYGLNFPTEYPHFPDDGIRYHFFFQFLAGNLEYLGLPLDWAYNLPSTLAFASLIVLLYSTAVILFGNRRVAVLTLVLLLFRSSFAVFDYLQQIGWMPPDQFIETLLTHQTFMGATKGEDWGLWTLNVFVNQRHLAFSLGILLLTLLFCLPVYFQMFRHLSRLDEHEYQDLLRGNLSLVYSGEALENAVQDERKKAQWQAFLTQADSWRVADPAGALVMGAVLGLTTFWNGAIVIATLLILFVMVWVSKHRLEYGLIAGVAGLLAIIQALFFTGLNAAPVAWLQFHPGFLAQQPTLDGIVWYYVTVFGLLPFVVLLGLTVLPRGAPWLSLAFLMPLLFATLFQLTPDIMANHKFVLVSIILLNMVAALWMVTLWMAGQRWKKWLAAGLLFWMTISGLLDTVSLVQINRKKVEFELNSPLIFWTLDWTRPDAVFLSYHHVHHPVLLAGRRLYYGWPYFAWTAGHDTKSRQAAYAAMFTERDPDRLRKLLEQNGIDYIMLDNELRESGPKPLNEDIIRTHFDVVYRHTGRSYTEIFQVRPVEEGS